MGIIINKEYKNISDVNRALISFIEKEIRTSNGKPLEQVINDVERIKNDVKTALKASKKERVK